MKHNRQFQKISDKLFQEISKKVVLNEADKAFCNEIFEETRFARNSILDEQDKKPQYLYFVIAGFMRMFYYDDNGDKVTTYLTSPNGFIASFLNFINERPNFSVSPIRQQIDSGMPVINGYSKHLFHQPTGWSKNIHSTGSWNIDTEPNFIPSAALVNFIGSQEPPIYVGFGSMKDIDAFKTTFQLILKALEITKQRAIVALGWNSLQYSDPIPGNIFLIESVPHS